MKLDDYAPATIQGVQIDGETRSSVARHDVMEIVRNTNREPEEIMVDSKEEATILKQIESSHQKIMQEILDRASKRVGGLGIELIDVRFQLMEGDYNANQAKQVC